MVLLHATEFNNSLWLNPHICHRSRCLWCDFRNFSLSYWIHARSFDGVQQAANTFWLSAERRTGPMEEVLGVPMEAVLGVPQDSAEYLYYLIRALCYCQ